MYLIRRGVPILGLVLAMAGSAAAQDQGSTRVVISGFAMMDMGYQTKQNDPAWFDVLRPTKLPSSKDEFGTEGRFFASVRQSRLGVQSFTSTAVGELFTNFEFDMYGTGADAGQTTIRLRHAWGQLGKFGAGQTLTPFMDIDMFPNSIEYWGPNGMVFFRNVQLRYTPFDKDGSNLQIALERPGASGDQGADSNRVQLAGIQARFPLPDLSMHYRRATSFGHVQVAGILRYMAWDDNAADTLGGSATGWGVNLTTNVKLGPHILRAGVVYGEGIENYMNDAPVDVGVRNDGGNLFGEALPVIGVSAFIDLNWNEKYTSTIGYSRVQITNSNGQALDAFRTGEYALANLLVHPLPNMFFGPEIQWGQRVNNRDSFKSNDVRVQFSAKYNFKQQFGGNAP